MTKTLMSFCRKISGAVEWSGRCTFEFLKSVSAQIDIINCLLQDLQDRRKGLRRKFGEIEVISALIGKIGSFQTLGNKLI